jgi:hypothetical protein
MLLRVADLLVGREARSENREAEAGQPRGETEMAEMEMTNEERTYSGENRPKQVDLLLVLTLGLRKPA